MINHSTGETAGGSPLRYDEALAQVKTLLFQILQSAPKTVREQTSHISGSTGKSIRAASLIVCSEDRNGVINPDAVKLAAAVELLHLATLVHDDVIDDAGTRRGIETLHRKFGKKNAVICGDYLFCLALKTASDVSGKKNYLENDLPDYMSRICLGELRQNQNNRNFNLTVPGYLRIIEGKTAALFEASFYAGSRLCEEEKTDAGLYQKLGHTIGMIFQLTDDCIDYESDEEKAKKPVLSDFEQGVITLPLIYAFLKNPELKTKAEQGTLQKEELIREVRGANGLSLTKLLSGRYYEKAKRMIAKLAATDPKKDRIKGILEKAYHGLK